MCRVWSCQPPAKINPHLPAKWWQFFIPPWKGSFSSSSLGIWNTAHLLLPVNNNLCDLCVSELIKPKTIGSWAPPEEQLKSTFSPRDELTTRLRFGQVGLTSVNYRFWTTSVWVCNISWCSGRQRFAERVQKRVHPPPPPPRDSL